MSDLENPFANIDNIENEYIRQFLESRKYNNAVKTTVNSHYNTLTHFERFLQDDDRNPGDTPTDLPDATEHMVKAWYYEIRNNDRWADSTTKKMLTQLNTFYRYYDRRERFDEFTTNPAALVVEETDTTIDSNPERRQLDINDMRHFIAQIDNVQVFAMILFMAKTGIRVSELCNLDIRDLHLADAQVKNEYPELRPKLEDHPDTVFVTSEISEGDVYAGEYRPDGNKRKRDTRIPIDSELKWALKRWLAVRPDSPSPADPLFCSTVHWGRRFTRGALSKHVLDEAKAMGWYEKGAGPERNVTPHYFRHWFTTHLRKRAPTPLVQYIRGDVGDETIDTYTHQWGRTRREYTDSIYSLL